MLSIDAVEQAKPGFGAPGPAGALYKHFGLTPDRVALAGRSSVRRARERVRVR
jgi:hypothetical protein